MSILLRRPQFRLLPWPGLQGPAASFTVSGYLEGVAATSASNAWAVGYTGSAARPDQAKTMIVRWNGTAWTRVPAPTPAGGAYLSGVAATSATSAWAVGATYTTDQTLILRWNGSGGRGYPARAQQATLSSQEWPRPPPATPGQSAPPSPSRPSPSGGTAASGRGSPARARAAAASASVTATSASNAWAVGGTGQGNFGKTLILHWNGTAWTRVPSPGPPGDSYLSGVAAIVRKQCLGGRLHRRGTSFHALIVRWNGSRWTRVPSPAGSPLTA